MKHRLQTFLTHKLSAILVLSAFLAVSCDAFADMGFWNQGTWSIQYEKDGNSNTFYNYTDKTTSIDLGSLSTLQLHGFKVKSWGSEADNCYAEVRVNGSSFNNTQNSYNDLSGGNKEWLFDNVWNEDIISKYSSLVDGTEYSFTIYAKIHCNLYNYDRDQTFTVKFTYSSPCTTAGGTAKVNGSVTATISRGASVTLSLTEETSGSTVVWKKSTDGGSSWSNVGGSTDTPDQNTQYRADVTAGGCTVNSTVATAQMPTTIYVDVKSSANWSAAYLYYWKSSNDSDKNHDWPGTVMTAVSGNDGWYSGEIAAGYDKYIINKGSGGNGNQTVNLDANGGQLCIKVKSASNAYNQIENTDCPVLCTAPTITTDVSGDAANYCVGTDAASVTALSVVLSGGTEPYSYQWYKNSSASTSGATLIDDATSSSYKPLTTASEVGINYYYCIVSSECGQSRQSGYSGAITVYDTSVSGSITGGGTYCQGEAGSTQTLTLGNSRGSIQWHGSTTSDFTPDNTTKITGADNVTYGAPISSSGTTYYKAVVTNGVCASATTAAQATVEVLPNPAPGTAKANGSTGEINIDDGDDVALTLTGYEAGEGVTIKWYKSIDNSAWDLADTPDPSAANYPSYTDEGVSQTTWYKAEVTKNSCTKYSNVIKVNAVTRIYFRVQSTSGCDPESDNAWFRLYCNLGGETCTRYRMWSYDRLNKIYYADVEAIGAVQYFIIDRVQDSHYDTDGSGVLWRTPDLPNDNTGRGSHNMWTASGCDTSTNPNRMTGSWSTFDPSTINEMPSLYIKGPLLTGNWGAYDKTAWDSETKDEVTGDYIYTKAFVANVTYNGGTGSDEVGKFTICLSTTEGNDTKLPNFYEQPGKTLSRTGISVISGGGYSNFKPDPMSSAGQYVTLTVVRHSLTNFEVSYCAGPVITQSPASPNPWEQVTLTLTSPSSSTATWELISNPTDEGYLSTQPDDATESTVLKAPYSSSAYKIRAVVSGGSGCSGSAIVDVKINSEVCN